MLEAGGDTYHPLQSVPSGNQFWSERSALKELLKRIPTSVQARFYDGRHGWVGGARGSGAPRSLAPAGNLIVAGGGTSTEWSDRKFYDYIVHARRDTSTADAQLWIAPDGEAPVLRATIHADAPPGEMPAIGQGDVRPELQPAAKTRAKPVALVRSFGCR